VVDRSDLLRRSVDALVRRGGDRSLVLLVDDAHLLDPVSATVIHQLAAHESASILLTVRTGEPAPDPVVALWKDDLAERIELKGLDVSTIERILSPALRGPVDKAAVVDLARRCEGNALFLRELVLGAIQDGTLRDDGGIWRFIGQRAPSERLVELVEIRLAGLSPEERTLLELVAFAEVVGPAEFDTLGPDVSGLADRLERKALLSSRTVGRRLEVLLAHPLYGEVLRARLPAVRARALARSLADAIEACGARRRGDTLRVATWRLEGGGHRPELMMAAATTARWHYDFPLAERLVQAALDGGAGFDAALLRAQLAGLQGRSVEAEEALVGLAAGAVDDTQRGMVAIARLDNFAFYLGELEQGVKIADEAARTISDPVWRDDLAARRVGLVGMIDGPAAAVEVAEPLLRLPPGRALVWAALPACLVLPRTGQIQRALDVSSLGYAAHLSLTQPLEWYPWMHLFCRCQALAYAGRLEEAQQLANEQHQQAVADRSPEAQAWFAWHLTSVVTVQGHVRESVAHGLESVALFRELGRPQFTYLSLLHLIQALALSGRGPEAKEAVQQLDDLGLMATRICGVDPLLARAWATVAAGDLGGGCELLREAASVGEAIGDILGAVAALHSLARLGCAREVRTRMAALAQVIEGPLAPARVAHVLALASRDPRGLASAADMFEALGVDLLAAEAATDAAVAWRTAGEPRRAAAAAIRAGALASRCEGAVTPALQGIETRARLTPAEYEAVALAAAGRSNKEIAGQLCISIRTAEGRLLRAFHKLGVASRTELAEALEADAVAAGGHE
jgi:DNA-binding CsgD family transcriptional regulator